MSDLSTDEQQVHTVTIELVNHSFACTINSPSAELSAFLDSHSARNVIVIPLFTGKEWSKLLKSNKGPGHKRFEKRLARRQKRLADIEGKIGAIQVNDSVDLPIPAVFSFDLDRLDAKHAAETAEFERIFCAGHSEGFEVLSTTIINDDEFSDLSRVRGIAREGLMDMARAVLNYRRLEEGLRLVGGRLW
ncbi:MAG TPA: hypothetical protein EYQ50_05685 [Verrucomicrobiales bacterium]|nr:hypothetical protein [Verrucomicrobiales bacterium]HIL72495.1 hypothetical protein [Verrucomicrobiota bacterium]